MAMAAYSDSGRVTFRPKIANYYGDRGGYGDFDIVAKWEGYVARFSPKYLYVLIIYGALQINPN